MGGGFTGLESFGEIMLKSHWSFGVTPILIIPWAPDDISEL